MLWNCGDCDSGEASLKPAKQKETDNTRGAVILKYKPASSTDGQVNNTADNSSNMSKEAAMGETPMQRYKRLRYQNEVVMGCPRVARPGSPTKRESPSKAARPGSPIRAPNSIGATPQNTPVKSTKLRAYRLNLERPFNILNEQSPLEYGDYMKIWEEKDYPPTVGPVEYMPPRHLGGNAQVWRTLMQYGRIAQEGCVGSSTVSHSTEQVNDIVLDADDEANTNATETIDTRPLSYSDWRVLTEEEIEAHKRLGEIDPLTGEYTFRTYDLTHVVERRFKNLSLQDLSIAEEDAVHDADETPNSSPTSAAMELVTVLSTESTGSDDDRAVIKSEEEMADMTARLFRRSELSLREKSEADARQAAEDKKRKEEEERARKAEEKRLEMEERAKAAEEGRKYKRSSTSGSSSSRGKFSSKKLMKSLSSISNKLVNELNGNATESYSRSGSGVCMNPKFKKSSSTQASAIEKARDLIDNEDEVEEDIENEHKKPLNLYIYGEYDVLNDLVNDGAKRLSRSKNLSDLDLLLQNDPCPPPDRWVRPTGWSRCNPSSCYAANPPEGYDLDSYGKNLVKLPKDDGHMKSTSTTQSPSISSTKAEERLNPKDSNATQSTAPSGSASEDLFDVTSSNRQKQHDSTKAKAAAPSSPVPQVKTLPTESCGTPQGAYHPPTSVTSTQAPCTQVPMMSRSTEVSASGNKKKSIGKRLSGLFKV